MAPRKISKATALSSSGIHRFEDEDKAEHFDIAREKKIVQERSIDFINIRTYRWLRFNNEIGQSNNTWVREYYVNALGYEDEGYTSYVHEKKINYAPEVIDGFFKFRPMEQLYAIIRDKPIKVVRLIAWSIKHMITTSDKWLGHPYVITTLYEGAEVPMEDYDDIETSPAPMEDYDYLTN
ncbi:hypothetical protein TSUD_300840 [Trifolium subterraneum]|uniref:Uncharacterized protein n=1 Tax=Trifolium subterraneum TaxID=3900 RepID=A0A2Z6PG75_TRISU|nr:hypothetical protein TSUD_300840 [Trifolium subterraneum]